MFRRRVRRRRRQRTAIVWHPEIVDPVDPDNWRDVLWYQAGFKWWRWHVGDEEAVEVENQEPGSMGASVFKIGETTYTLTYAEGLDTTSLVEITPQGEFKPALEGPGQIIGNGVIKIR